MSTINLLKASEDAFHSDEVLRTIDDLKNDQLFYNLSRATLKGISYYYVRAAAETSDDQLALNYTLSWICISTFKQALEHYSLNGEVEFSAYESFIRDLIALNKKRQAGKFQLESFWESPLVQEYVRLLEALITDTLIDKQRIRVRNYLKDYTPLEFTRHLSFDPTVRVRLQAFLKGGFHEAQVDKYFRDKYYTDLRNSFLEVTLNDPNGMTLDHIYQEPGFSVFERCVKEEVLEKINRDIFIASDTLKLEDTLHDFINYWAADQLDCEQLKRQDPRLIMLYGFPGQGKTSFCRKLLHDILTSHPIEHDVYFIRLRALKKPHLLKSEILSTLHAHLTKQLHLTISEESLSRSLIILDGLDELFMTENLRGSDIDLILQKFVQEIKQNKDLRILMTSRLGYLDTEQISSRGLLLLKLDVFDLQSQKEWLEAFRAFHPDCWLTEEKLKKINKGRGYLKELVSQPILLHMIASLEEDITKDVANKGKVYELLFKQITNPIKWKDHQIDILEKLEAMDLRSALCEIAFHIFISGKEFIHKDKLEQLKSVKDLKEKVGGRQLYFEKALKLLMVAFYLQEVPNESRRDRKDEDDHEYAVEFLHKSLQEYLTAEYIWEQTKEVLLDQNKKGKYIVDSEAGILEFLQKILGHQPLSVEIGNYLAEIIGNDNNNDEKWELSERLEYAIDYCLLKQFVFRFDANSDDSVIDLGKQIFYGYWTIYSCLKESNSLFPDEKAEQRKLFASMLQYSRAVISFPPFNLQGMKLKGVNLVGIDLRETNLDGANISEANLEDADLSRGTLQQATFIRAHLLGVDFGLSNLENANLRAAQLSGADFGGSNLTGANLEYATLVAASLRNTNLQQANLEAADLRGADLCEANLRGANLKNVILNGHYEHDVNGVLYHEKPEDSYNQLAEAASLEGVQGLPEKWLEEIGQITKEKDKS